MEPTVTHIPDSALDAIIASYVQAIERGEVPDRARLIADHPSQAEALAAFFADQDKLLLLTRPAASPLAPQSLLGSYRIVREIGRGGMGIVYEAIHEALKKRVALKLLPVSPLTAGSHLDRFLREAQTAASLHHTNIVPVFDVGQVEGIPFYAMQFIEGKTLDKLSAINNQQTADSLQLTAKTGASHAPLSPGGRGAGGEGARLAKAPHYRHIADLGRQAALGLAHAHSRGVIHRDIKPSNLILDEEGTLWITDFGLAKRFTVEDTEVPLTLSGQMLGTPRYMSPEQAAASKNPIDHRTDLYSLGVTLYELLVGKPAFAGQTPPEVVQNILTREAEPLRRHDPQLPRDLETVVLKAMAKRPGDRYATAQELADDLGRFLAGEPVQARRIGVLGRTLRWAKREPRVAGLVGAVVGSLVLGLAGIVTYNFQLQLERSKTVQLNEDMVEFLKSNSITIGSAISDLENGNEYKAMLWFCLSNRNKLSDFQLSSILANYMRHFYIKNIGKGELMPSYEFDSMLSIQQDPIEDTLLREKLQIHLNELARKMKSTELIIPSKMYRARIASATPFLAPGPNECSLIMCYKFEYGGKRCYTFRLWSNDKDVALSPSLRLDDDLEDVTPEAFAVFNMRIEKGNIIYKSSRENVDGEMPVESVSMWCICPQFENSDQALALLHLLACHRLDRGRYVPLTLDEAHTGWQTLQSKYPDVFTIPIEQCLAWHLKEDADSVRTKHQHAALFAANFDCRDRPNDPHPFVARGRLFTVLGQFDKAERDFATAWKLGGTGWVKSECRRMVRDAWRWVQANPHASQDRPLTPNPSPSGGEGNQTPNPAPIASKGNQTGELQVHLAKLRIAATYLEQDPRTMCALLLGKPPLHRLALALVKQRLGLEWDERDKGAITRLVPSL